MQTQKLYEKNIELLNKLSISYKEYSHEPILDYETAKKVKVKLGWTAVESKNLFLKSKKDKYYMLLTVEGKKADFDLLKKLIGEQLSLATPDELKKKTGCIPGCATPFCNDEGITIIFDKQVMTYKKIIYSPVDSKKSIEIETKDIPKILDSIKNKIITIQ